MHANGTNMGDIKISVLHKALGGLQSKALLICILVLPLLLFLLPLPLTLPHLETLMPSISNAILAERGRFGGPAFAFLLLNCVVATLVASSRLESEQRQQSEDRNRGKMRQMEDLRDEKKADVGKISHNYESSEGERSSCSLNITLSVDAIKEEPTNHIVVNERKAIGKGSFACRENYRKARLRPSKPLKSSTLKDGKLDVIDSSFSANPERLSVLENHFDSSIAEDNTLGRTGIHETSDHPPRRSHKGTAPTAPALAAASTPSLEEVWAAIISSKSHDQPVKKQPHHSNVAASSQSVTATASPAAVEAAPSPAAASIQSVTAAPTPPAAATFKAAHNPAPGAPSKARFATAATGSKHVEDVNGEENDGEVEKLNRRAGAFIARFNRQMRLQREESLQRHRGRRPCNSEIHSLHHLRLPGRGLLVG